MGFEAYILLALMVRVRHVKSRHWYPRLLSQPQSADGKETAGSTSSKASSDSSGKCSLATAQFSGFFNAERKQVDGISFFKLHSCHC